MGVKTEIVEAVSTVASTRLTTTLGLGTFMAGVWNNMGFSEFSIDKFAVLSGALITIAVGVVTVYVKLSEWKEKKRLYRIAQIRYKAGGTIPEELLDGDDKKEGSSLL